MNNSNIENGSHPNRYEATNCSNLEMDLDHPSDISGDNRKRKSNPKVVTIETNVINAV